MCASTIRLSTGPKARWPRGCCQTPSGPPRPPPTKRRRIWLRSACRGAWTGPDAGILRASRPRFSERRCPWPGGSRRIPRSPPSPPAGSAGEGASSLPAGGQCREASSLPILPAGCGGPHAAFNRKPVSSRPTPRTPSGRCRGEGASISRGEAGGSGPIPGPVQSQAAWTTRPRTSSTAASSTASPAPGRTASIARWRRNSRAPRWPVNRPSMCRVMSASRPPAARCAAT